ncbi:MAG: metal ABC transporter permease [Spirochaetia bacterium]|nr:metal ABC transporter permease [Spirochaetia bacterium]MBQ3648543.1 metal ABC transporter permease [Spirochaetia bacterium]MBQ3713229.1 metal ABC transporter permease [Spirochaetia bacterium]MBQ6673724.1 metal ABC transporter permease [Spirochaetia bacterium]MBR0319333.1 metal ABC transporter permease [Spirochaetia bacterium]
MLSEFWAAITDPAVPFIRYALFAGLLSSIAFGMIGSYVVIKRMSYIVGAVSHVALGGIGAVILLNEKLGLAFSPIIGALVASVLAAVVISLVELYSQERSDSVIGAVWAVGMALGIVCIALSSGYADPMSYLFGNILLISHSDLITIMLLDLVVIFIVIRYYHVLKATAFDETFAIVRGINTVFLNVLLNILIAITVVLMVSLVGVVMSIAFLTIPAAAASLVVRRLSHIMTLGAILCAIFSSSGLFLSYTFDLPTGAVTIILSGIVYLALALCSKAIVRHRR